MICEHCKEREATTHIKQNINGNKTEMFLCSECAEKLGMNEMFEPITLGSFFGNFLSASTSAFNSLAGVDRCSYCGSSFNDIIDSGKVGCAHCYDRFYDRLAPSIEKLHGKTRHVGKSVTYTEDESKEKTKEEKKPINKIDELKAELKQAIKEQRFEDAAVLRDKIRDLTSGENNNG